MINLTRYNNVKIFGDPPKLRFHIENNNESINIFITKDEEQCITTELVCGLAQSSDGYRRKNISKQNSRRHQAAGRYKIRIQ